MFQYALSIRFFQSWATSFFGVDRVIRVVDEAENGAVMGGMWLEKAG